MIQGSGSVRGKLFQGPNDSYGPVSQLLNAGIWSVFDRKLSIIRNFSVSQIFIC
jgi:hypothetical protein